MIIDEEQKFGVKIKEQLKKLRINIDAITLTATPIPRTLHFPSWALETYQSLPHHLYRVR